MTSTVFFLFSTVTELLFWCQQKLVINLMSHPVSHRLSRSLPSRRVCPTSEWAPAIGSSSTCPWFQGRKRERIKNPNPPNCSLPPKTFKLFPNPLSALENPLSYALYRTSASAWNMSRRVWHQIQHLAAYVSADKKFHSLHAQGALVVWHQHSRPM